MNDIARSVWLEKLENGFSLEFASKIIKDDKELVCVSLKNNGMNLEFASDRLKDDIEVVLEAMKQNAMALSFASDRVRNEIILRASNDQNDLTDFVEMIFNMADNEEYNSDDCLEYISLSRQLDDLLQKQMKITNKIAEVKNKMVDLYPKKCLQKRR